MHQKEVVVETSFLASVPNGKANGLTVKGLEGDLMNTFQILCPLLLSQVLQGESFAIRTRKHLRTLQYTGDESIAISNPIGVDVVEVGKSFLEMIFENLEKNSSYVICYSYIGDYRLPRWRTSI